MYQGEPSRLLCLHTLICICVQERSRFMYLRSQGYRIQYRNFSSPSESILSRLSLQHQHHYLPVQHSNVRLRPASARHKYK